MGNEVVKCQKMCKNVFCVVLWWELKAEKLAKYGTEWYNNQTVFLIITLRSKNDV